MRIIRTSATLLAAGTLLGMMAQSTGAQEKQAGSDTTTASSLTPTQLAERLLYRRAVEAVIWGMPAVNAQLMYDAVKQVGGDFNQIVYWSRPLSWKNQTLTPNPDTIYVFPFYNTKDVGPMVLEIPPADQEDSITGSVDDGGRRRWRMSARPASTRARAASTSSCRRATKRRRRTATSRCRRAPTPASPSCAPTSRAAATPTSPRPSRTASASSSIRCRRRRNPPETKFVDAIDVVFDSTIPYDLRFFEALDRFVQREPWLDRDRAMIDPLKTIGIEKGKPFKPDEKTQTDPERRRARGARLAGSQVRTPVPPPYNEGTHWGLPASPAVLEGMMTDFADPNDYPVDGRGVTYSYAYFSPKHLGEGQFYLMTIADKDGKPSTAAAPIA